MSIDELVLYARSLVGLTADPASPWRAEYLSVIAPGETPARAAEMALMYGCELTALAVWRRFISHPLLEAPYITGHAGFNIMAIAREAHAVRPIQALPEAGDVVLVSPPEHAWICLGTVAENYDGAALYDGLDGLPVDGHRAITTRQHLIRNGRDDAGGDRAVIVVVDTGKVLQAFGR
jgi:hypothetical protein